MIRTDMRIIPEKLLYEMEAATRMAEIRPGMDRETLMFQAGKRRMFEWICKKVGVDPIDVRRKSVTMYDHMSANAVPGGTDE